MSFFTGAFYDKSPDILDQIYGANLIDEWSHEQSLSLTEGAVHFVAASSQSLVKVGPTFVTDDKLTVKVAVKLNVLPPDEDEWTLASQMDAGWQNGWTLQIYMETGEGPTFIFALWYQGTASFSYGDSFVVVGQWTELTVVLDTTQPLLDDRVSQYYDGSFDNWPGGFDGDFLNLEAGTNPIHLGTAPLDYGAGSLDLQCVGFAADALEGDALTASFTSTFYADMDAARKADWASFWNLCESSGVRADSAGVNDLTAVNAPTYAVGLATGTIQDRAPRTQWTGRRNGEKFVSPADIATAPTWNLVGQNGLPDVSYDGSQVEIGVALNALLSGTRKPFTFSMVVYSPQPSGLSKSMWDMRLDAGGSSSHGFLNDAFETLNTARRADNAGLATWTGTGSTANMSAAYRLYTYVFTGTTVTIWMNGAKVADDVAFITNGDATFDNMTLAGNVVGGVYGNFLSGKIQRFFLAAQASSDAEAEALNDYMNDLSAVY